MISNKLKIIDENLMQINDLRRELAPIIFRQPETQKRKSVIAKWDNACIVTNFKFKWIYFFFVCKLENDEGFDAVST